MQGSAQEKKKNVFQPEKRSRFQKNYRRRHPTPLRARTNITPQTYGTEEVLEVYHRVQTNEYATVLTIANIFFILHEIT